MTNVCDALVENCLLTALINHSQLCMSKDIRTGTPQITVCFVLFNSSFTNSSEGRRSNSVVTEEVFVVEVVLAVGHAVS